MELSGLEYQEQLWEKISEKYWQKYDEQLLTLFSEVAELNKK